MNLDPVNWAKRIGGVRLRRSLKLVAVDGLAFAASLWLSMALRFDFNLPLECQAALPRIVFWVVLTKLVLFYCFRQFHILPDFFGLRELRRLALSSGYAAVVVALIDWDFLASYSPPPSVFIVDGVLSFIFLAATRVVLRIRRERMRKARVSASSRIRRVGIVGAGEAGAILARELRSKQGLGLEPVAFFDDDARKWDATVHDIPVAGRPEVLLTNTLTRLNLDEVVISMPSAPPARIREVIDILQRVKLKFRTVPSLTELALGKVQVSQLRSVEVEDLLGRPPIELATDEIRSLLYGKRVLVTGAGGSIGSELCRQIFGFGPARLALLERSEVAIFAIEQELISRGAQNIQPVVADILDKPRLRQVFSEFRPHVIFHAAAHKHVPMMESQPGEAVRNNTLGTMLLADTAVEFGVERFVFISTDKAINPTSVMGATKRLAEVLLQSMYASNTDGTRFMAVRFGNVLGSSGSVIPTFKRQIAAGGPVTVTHPDMTRYFMTIPEAVGLVLQSGVQGQGGEVFVLDMGKPVRILDLARQLIELSGLQPERDIRIEFVGLRPGEKLFEELNLDHESLSETKHSKIRRLQAHPQPLASVKEILRRLAAVACSADADELKCLLKEAVPEYTPSLASKQPALVLRNTMPDSAAQVDVQGIAPIRRGSGAFLQPDEASVACSLVEGSVQTMTAYQRVEAALREHPQRWLVTGAAGFIGSHLIEALLELNQQVIGLDNFSTGRKANLETVRSIVGEAAWKRFRFIEGDICSREVCVQACRGADFVLHQAALGSVPRSIEEPVRSFESNVMGFLQLLNAARSCGVQRVIYASSSSVYGDNLSLPKREEKTGRPLSPYAATKMFDEIIAEVFARSYGLNSIGLRYFNVFGPRQDPAGPYAAVIPKWIETLRQGEPVCIYGDGETSRDFCYVKNVVQANFLAATTKDPDAVNQVYNVAASARMSLNRLFELLRTLLAPEHPSVTQLEPVYREFRSGDVRHSEADLTKIRKLLGYEPAFTAEEGLALTVTSSDSCLLTPDSRIQCANSLS